jgi:hypothetical protein
MKKFNEHIDEKPGFPKMETGFKVPEGYFESFGERLKSRMEAERQVSRPMGVLRYLKPALGIAAGLAILLSVYVHFPINVRTGGLASVNISDTLQQADRSDQMLHTYASIISEGQFFSALSEMDDYDASKMPKDALEDYLASNCSEFEILNANK